MQETGVTTHSNRSLALVIICAVQMMVILDGTIVNIALPSIQRELHFSPAGLEWVIAAYALAFGGMLLLGGRSGDLFGRRRMFTIGVWLFTVASLLGGLAQSPAMLVAARVAQGVGGAIASPTALALIQSTFPEGRERARAMGVYAAMSGAGGSLGLLLGGVLTDIASWRWVLFVNVPIGVLVALGAPRVLGDTPTRPGRLDLPGALSVTGGMTALVYGLSNAAEHGWGATATVVSLILASALLVTFVLVESRSAHALMPLHIFSDRNRAGAYAVMLCLAGAMFGTFFFITQYVQDILGYSPLRAGVAFLPMTIGIGATATVVSRVVTKVGPKPFMTAGPFLAALGLFGISFVGVHSSYLAVIAPLVLIAVGMGSTFVPLTLTVMARVRPHEAGLASALLNTAQQIGGSLGLATLVTVATAVTAGHHLSRGAGVLALHQAVVAGYDDAFRVSAGVALAGFVLAALVVRAVRPAPHVVTSAPEPEPERVVA
ncbi:MAG: MFS transporter [Acidimicrobiales bacterium]